MKSAVLIAVSLCAASCGYHTSGHSNLLPKTAKTICIPAFANATVHYNVTDQLPEAIAKEFIARTRYHIVSDPDTADLVLRGTVLNYIAGVTVIDPVTGRGTAANLDVFLKIELTERATGKVLYSRPSMDARERFEVSENEQQYFDESGPAVERLAKFVAEQVVSAILTSF
jgi:Lipopolysaccharide-assembly